MSLADLFRPPPPQRVKRRSPLEAYEAAHWPDVRRAWIKAHSKHRCMACGVKRRFREDPWYKRIFCRPLQVHHAEYPWATIAGRLQRARGAGERYFDLVELCNRCHFGGGLKNHDRSWDNLAKKTWRRVRRRALLYFWRKPPVPSWAWLR